MATPAAPPLLGGACTTIRDRTLVAPGWCHPSSIPPASPDLFASNGGRRARQVVHPLAATAGRTSSVSGIFDGLETTKAPPETVRERETYRGNRLCVVGVGRPGSIERSRQRIDLRRDLRGPAERAREAADQATDDVFGAGGPKTVFTGNLL